MSLEEVNGRAPDVAVLAGGGKPAVVSGGESNRLIAPLSDGLRWVASTYRSERNPSRSSEAYSSGCSQAAKWPPRSTSLKCTRLGYAFSVQLRGDWKISSGKTLTATGTVTLRTAR